jgi:hypothetical protein
MGCPADHSWRFCSKCNGERLRRGSQKLCPGISYMTPRNVAWALSHAGERQGYKDKNISEGYTGEETCDVSGPSPAVY